MDPRYADARRYFFLLAASFAAVWAALAQEYVFSALFAAAALLIAVAGLLRGFRRASSVIDGADRMLDDTRRSRSAAATPGAEPS